jgi:WD40 repeat protein
MSDSLPVSVQLRLEEACARFEGAWRAAGAGGAPPGIGAHLSRAAGPERQALLWELLLLDVHYRRRRGERPGQAHYAAQFPGDGDVIRGALAAASAGKPPPVAAESSRATLRPGAGVMTMPDPYLTRPEGGPGQTAVREPGCPTVPGYEVLGELGRGGMGVVYKARHLTLKRTVALKMIRGGSHASPQELARFRTEAEAVARLGHPNIVQVFEVGAHDGLPYCALEFVDGGSLEARLKGGPLRPDEAARLVGLLARAMHLAHSRNIVHRDLKPANVLLTTDGAPKVTDFGLARQLDADGQHTVSGAVMGTPSYMAPEQASGRAHEAGPPADVYALGAILYACLTGWPPFRGATQLEILEQVRGQEPVSPRALRPEVPRDLETICLKCLRKESERRYASAQELADDLGRFGRGEPVAARAVGAAERLAKWVRRRPAVAGLLAASALAATALLALGVGWLYYQSLDAAYQSEGEQRKKAEEEKQRAEVFRKRAEEEKQRAEVFRKRAEGLFYAVQVADARRAWQVGDIVQARELLDACQWDLRGWEYRYVCSLVNRTTRAFLHHTAAVQSVCFSPDGRRLASASFDGTVKVCDAVTGQATFSLKGHAGAAFHSVCFSPDGTRLASASSDRTVRVWDTARGEVALTLLGHTGTVFNVCFSPDGRRLASASEDRTVKVWDTEKGQDIITFKGHIGPILCVCFSPDGRRLASASYDGTVKVWDAATGQDIITFKKQDCAISCVCFSPDGRRLASASWDRTVKVWDAATGQEALTLKAIAKSVCFSPDGTRLASGGDGTVTVWDAATGRETLTRRGHNGPVWSVCFSPDGCRLASASEDRTVRVWEAAAGQEALTLKGHTRPISCLCFGTDNRRLVSASYDETVRVWDTTTGQPVLISKGHTDNVEPISVCFSPDGKRLASASGTKVRVWDTATGQETLTLTVPGVGGVCFSPDGKRLAGSWDALTMKVWDVATGEEALTLKGHTSWEWSVCFSPDGQRLAGASGGTVKLWDTATGQETLTLTGHREHVRSVCFSPDGKRLASASDDLTVKVWDVATGEEALTLKGHTRTVCSVCFSPDGQRLASISADCTVKLWSAATGQETLSLPTSGGHSVCFSPDGKQLASASGEVWDASTGWEGLAVRAHKGICGVCFSPDAKRFAGASAGGTVAVWDGATGQEALTLKGHAGFISGVCFSPDGRRLAGACVDGTVKFWEATPLPESGQDQPVRPRS